MQCAVTAKDSRRLRHFIPDWFVEISPSTLDIWYYSKIKPFLGKRSGHVRCRRHEVGVQPL